MRRKMCVEMIYLPASRLLSVSVALTQDFQLQPQHLPHPRPHLEPQFLRLVQVQVYFSDANEDRLLAKYGRVSHEQT
jgi:hypothetical protein